MDFSLEEIRSSCEESKHSEIAKMVILPSQIESFVIDAISRGCSICINMILWRMPFTKKTKQIIRGFQHLPRKRRSNILLRINYFTEHQEDINTLLDAFREERFETLKGLFCSNKSAVRNFAYQLAMERQLKEDNTDALLLLLQWEKEQLEEKFDMHKHFLEKSRVDGLTSVAEVDPHHHVVSKLGEFMLRFDLPNTEPPQKKIKLEEKVPFVSEIYDRLKLDEAVMVHKWLERTYNCRTYKKIFKADLESNLLQIYCEDFNSYRKYFLLNYPSLIAESEMESGSGGQNVFEYLLSTPDVGISVEILRNIVKAKPSVVSWIKEETGDNILHWYLKTRTDKPEIVRFIVEELGLDPLRENKSKENALECFLRVKWSEDGIYESFENIKEILEYLEAKNPLNGAEYIQKFSIFTGFSMIYRSFYDWHLDQQFFLEYAMKKFYGPEVNQDYSLIERFEECYGPNVYFRSPHYAVVALLHNVFDEDNFYQISLQTKLNLAYFIQEYGSIYFINETIKDLNEKFYDESDENLKLFFEIIMKIERIYTRFTDLQTVPKFLSCLPPYDEGSTEGFKKKHIERMIRVFNELISERNIACATIQEAIETWPVENITTDIFNHRHYLREGVYRVDHIPLRAHNRLMRKIIRSGLFSVLYSFTCHWKFTLRDEDDLNAHYEKLKMFLGKIELFLPESLYPQEGEVFGLKHLCRLEIRQMLIKDGSGDIATYVEKIKSLGLPKKMENYIRFLPEC